jgi:hypothetical protein
LTTPIQHYGIEAFPYKDHGEEVEEKTRELKTKEEVEEKTRR